MFQYQSLFRRHASDQALKIIGLTILSGLLIIVSFFAVLIISMLPVYAMGESVWVFVYIFFIFFLLFLTSIFIIYPLSIGIIRFFTSAYLREPYGFGDLFFVFKGRRYGKAVKLTLLVLVSYVVISFGLSMIMQLIFAAVNVPFSALMGGVWFENGVENSAAMMTGQTGLFILMAAINLVLGLLMYVPFIFLMIYMILIYLVYVDQPHIPTFDKFSIAFKVMFQSGQSLVRLFFSNILLLAGVTVLYVVMLIGGILVAGLLFSLIDNQVIVALVMIIVTILLLIAYIYVMYLVMGSIVSYYFRGRETLDRRAAAAVYGTEEQFTEDRNQ